MNVRPFLPLLAAALLSSCFYYTPPVADMPYRPGRRERLTPAYPNTWVTQPPTTPAAPASGAAALPSAPVAPSVMPPVNQQVAVIPTPATPKPAAPAPVAPKPVVPAPVEPKPAALVPSVTKTVNMNQPTVVQQPKPAPAPAVKPVTVNPVAAAAPTSAAKPAASANPAPTPIGRDPKSITNQGPIPVATRVEGDPTRVYNPLDPSKTIRVIDKNGKPYPSGKELKVRGTNFHFYVP